MDYFWATFGNNWLHFISTAASEGSSQTKQNDILFTENTLLPIAYTNQ